MWRWQHFQADFFPYSIFIFYIFLLIIALSFHPSSPLSRFFEVSISCTISKILPFSLIADPQRQSALLCLSAIVFQQENTNGQQLKAINPFEVDPLCAWHQPPWFLSHDASRSITAPRPPTPTPPHPSRNIGITFTRPGCLNCSEPHWLHFEARNSLEERFDLNCNIEKNIICTVLKKNNLTAYSERKKGLEMLTSLADVQNWQPYNTDAVSTQIEALGFCQCSANLHWCAGLPRVMLKHGAEEWYSIEVK